MGAPVALASDPLKRSSFLQILYLRIKHGLSYYGVWLIDAAITHLPHTKNCSVGIIVNGLKTVQNYKIIGK